MEIDDLAILASILAHIRHGDSPKPMLPIGRRWSETERIGRESLGVRWRRRGRTRIGVEFSCRGRISFRNLAELMRVIEEHVRSAVVTQFEQNLSMTKAFSWTKNDVGISRQHHQRGHRAMRTWRSLGNIGEK